jgi:antitoxin component of RelBE/YafQ-DinJ toxin-antitoxin module
MNMSTAFNVFLRKSVDEEAIPFPVSVKRSDFGAGYTPSEF